ncbi:DNA methyltransferase [Methylobacterium sp. WCS2018Hpa-22]|uniref:DNA-methyltransferase n=1 Tax=Methylobacterium sp. WCS2018Hpa-22 TaxID=3073633 RepID=UPI00288AF9C7|nr:DNA methyltransferase [Methylobacterium sp. WCS2018Hpa-22]
MSARTFFNGRAEVHHGDSRDVLKTLADGSIDSVVCDPPYALVSIVKRFGKAGAAPGKDERGASGAYARASAGFLGQQWDTGETAFAVEFWSEVFRVLKPGGHVVAFSGTRTYHRLAIAIEDSGFEIRDQLGWLYGTGFPKSHDVAKGIDKSRTEDREPTRRICRFVRAAMDAKGLKSRHLVPHFGGCNARLIDHWAARDTDSQPNLPTPEQWATLKTVLGFGDEMDAEFNRLAERKGTAGDAWNGAEVIGHYEGETPGFGDVRFTARDTSIRAATEAARQWEGWGTALKPAWEPIVLARKPLVGTVAENVLAYGLGAVNIGGCRYGDDDRFPANVLHDGSIEVVDAFDQYAEGVSRFFYSAKASKADRAGSKHPTVKPVDLMRWLVRLVTPRGGLVLEPFAGSGSTLQAAIEEGARVIGVEREAQFFADCCNRLESITGARPLSKLVRTRKPRVLLPRIVIQPSFFEAA